MEIAATVRVPLEGNITTVPSGYVNLIRFYNSCRKHFDCVIFVDLENLIWIDANLSALLQAILYKLNKENKLLFSIDLSVVQNKFPILFKNGFLTDLLALPDSFGTTVKMKTFSPASDVEFYNYINGQLLGHPQMVKNLCDEIVGDYMEVFSNVSRHARTTDPVFACGQYYPKNHKLCFTLVDLGVGFLPPIKEYTNGKISTAAEAISWALEYNHSSKHDGVTGGLGLYNLLNHCKDRGGDFSIATGDAYWGNNLGALGTRTVPAFVGTTIHLLYNCN